MAQIARANEKAFDACIVQAARRNPSLDVAGRSVNLRMIVQPSGNVTYPTLDDVEVNGTDLGACLKSAARRMVFPRFEGAPSTVEVPVRLGR